LKPEKPKTEIAGKNYCQQDFSFRLSTDLMPNGLRYWRWGGRRNAVQTEKTNSVEKCLKMAPESPASSARFVGTLFDCKTTKFFTRISLHH